MSARYADTAHIMPCRRLAACYYVAATLLKSTLSADILYDAAVRALCYATALRYMLRQATPPPVYDIPLFF